LLERYAACPVCGKKTVLKVPPDILKEVDRYPFTVRVKHGKHHFYINLDSQAWITDILSPEMVE
jgi:DNA-directed RNA polymerase subunit RPC12/RpoP